MSSPEPLFGDNTDSDPDYIPEAEKTKKSDLKCLVRRIAIYKKQISLSPSKSAKKRKIRNIKKIEKIVLDVKSGGRAVDWAQVPDPLQSKETTIQTQTSSLATEELPASTQDEIGENALKRKPAPKTTRKENYCIYCSKQVKEFCKHFENVHKDTPEGKELILLNKLSDPKKRKELKTKLTSVLGKKGNAHFSELLLKQNILDGSELAVVPVKKGNKPATHLTMVKCKYCSGFYVRRKFPQHLKKCSQFVARDANTSKTPLEGKQFFTVEHTSPIITAIKGASPELVKDVLNFMKPSKTKDNAIRDELLMKYTSEFQKSRRNQFQRTYVSRVITDLSRLVLRVQEKLGEDKVSSLEDLFDPSLFETLVECILQEAGYNCDTGSVTVCGLGNRLRSHLKSAALTAKNEALKDEYNGDGRAKEKRKRIKHFLEVFENKWANEAGRIFDMAAKQSRAEKGKKLAAEEDIIKTCKFITSNYRKVTKQLDAAKPGSTDKQNTYNDLLDMLVSHIMCLIRRRPVDFKRGLNTHYEKIDSQDQLIAEIKNSEAMEISEEDLKMCNNFHIFYVPGKGWKELVPITLTLQMKEAFDAIQRNKQHVGVASDKLFIRARNLPIDPRECLRKVTKNLDLKKPMDLSGNGLRHHAATFSKLHSTHPQYQDYLASALGHSLHIHRLHYELPSSLLQKLIVMPVLEKMTKPRDVQETNSEHETSTLNNEQVKEDEETSTLNNEQVEEDEETSTLNNEQVREDEESDSSSSESFHNTYRTPPKKEVEQRRRWSDEEKQVIFQKFGDDIINGCAPNRASVVKFYNSNVKSFPHRSKQSLVTYINNLSLRKQKNVTPEVKKFRNRLCNVPI